MFRQVIAQCLRAITLGRMMPRSEIVNAGLARHVHGLFGNFTAQVSIHPQRLGLLDIALRRAGTPGNAA